MHTLRKSLHVLVIVLFLAVCFPLLASEARAYEEIISYEEYTEPVVDEAANEEFNKDFVVDEPEYTPEPPQDIAPQPDVEEDVSPAPVAYVFSIRGDPFANEVIRLINYERFRAGVAPVETHASLQTVARIRAQEGLQLTDEQFVNHLRPGGQQWYTAFAESNICRTFYGNSSENVARRFNTPEQTVSAWMDSQPHRENILADYWVTTGVAVARNPSGVIDVVQIFCAAS